MIKLIIIKVSDPTPEENYVFFFNFAYSSLKKADTVYTSRQSLGAVTGRRGERTLPTAAPNTLAGAASGSWIQWSLPPPPSLPTNQNYLYKKKHENECTAVQKLKF